MKAKTALSSPLCDARKSDLDLNQKDLLASVRGELFAADAPRLPSPPILAFNSAQLSRGVLPGDDRATAIRLLSPDDPIFTVHFPGDPIYPASLQIEATFQLLGLYAAWMGFRGRGRALGLGRTRFVNQVCPSHGTQELSVNVAIRAMDHSRQIIIGDAELAYVDQPCAYFSGAAVKIVPQGSGD